MVSELKAAFPVIVANSCLEENTNTEIGIYDCPKTGKCKIQTKTNGLIQFTILNPNSKTVNILYIDKCMLMDDDDLKRCDFAFFDKKDFCFVELKMPKSKNGEAANRSKAKKQLINMIQYFRSKVVFKTKRTEAYVCLYDTVPIPATTATLLDEIIQFEDIGATLYHGNSKKIK